MGSKSNGAPAPDPRLVEAQIRSLGVQDSMIQEIIGQSNSMRPLQEEQMRLGIDASRTAYEQSQQDRQWALGKRGQLDAAQAPLLEEARNFNFGNRRAEMMNEANADISQAFSSAEAQGLRTMSRMGVGPNSGRSSAMVNQTNVQEAMTKAAAGRKVSEAARAEGMQLKSNAVNMLSGYPAMGMQNTAAGAGYGAAGLGLANTGLGGMTSGYGMAGGMAGNMGQNATSMYGIQSRDHYSNQGGDSMGSILGGLGGLAAGAAKVAPFFMSDRRMKTDIVLIGKDNKTGLNMYEFTYKDLPGHRYIGVMADEVAKVMPEAVVRTEDGYDVVNYKMLGIEMVEV